MDDVFKNKDFLKEKEIKKVLITDDDKKIMKTQLNLIKKNKSVNVSIDNIIKNNNNEINSNN